MPSLDKHLTIRDADKADIAALTTIKGAGTEIDMVKQLE
jgi:hypothetical protein